MVGKNNPHGINPVVKRAWILILILTLVVGVWPIGYRVTRVMFASGLIFLWAGAMFLWWSRKGLRVALITAGIAAIFALCLPGRSVDIQGLAADYFRALRLYRNVPYVWGGEGFLGIDCSGLVRKGLVWGQINNGIRTLNGEPIRNAISLWWHDSSAADLRDGHRDWTFELFRHENITQADTTRLRIGDLAVTADGLHVLAYLGQNSWIEADPDAGRVIEVSPPTDNPWFNVPVVFMRWTCLAE